MVSPTKETNMQLLQDVFIMDNLQVIEEGAGGTKMKIRGTFQRAEEANNNGRVYPTKVLEGQIKKLQPLITERRLCGELDHPQNDTVKLSNASHLVTKLHMEGNEVIGEAEILKTPAGLTAQALVHGGVSIGISSRGMGTLSEDANGAKVVNEDFNLVTFDLVADPSTRGAYPSLAESRESKFVKTTQSKLQKESNFITMLESKMRDAYQPWIDESRESKKTEAARKRAEAKKKAEAEEAQTETDAFKKTSMKDHFELIKAEGHWHRIAEAIAVAMGHELDEGIKDVVKGAHEKVRKFLGKNVHPSLHSKKEKKAKAERKATRKKGEAETGASNKKLRAEKPARDAKERKKIKAEVAAKAKEKDYPKHQPGQDPKYAAPGEDLPGGGSRHRKVKLDHTEYHRIGYILAEKVSDFLDPEDTDTRDVTVTRKEKKEGHISRALRQRSERKHAEKTATGTAIATAKGKAKGTAITRKGERKEAMKDVKAKGSRDRGTIKQGTKTHATKEKSKSAKARSTMAGKEQRAFDKTASPLKRGTSHTTRAVHGATRDAAEKAVEKTGEGISKGAEGLGRVVGKGARSTGKAYKWARDVGSDRAKK